MRFPPLFNTTLLAASLLGVSACATDSDETIGKTPQDASEDAPAGEVVDGDANRGVDAMDGGETGGVATEDSGDAGESEEGGESEGSGESESTDPVAPPAETAALNDPTPRFATMACGAMPISDVSFSSTASAPAVFTTNTIVNGRIDPDSGNNTVHYWSVDLQPGFYHLVQDATRLDGRSSNLGLTFESLNGPDAEEGARLLRSNDIAYHLRDHEFLEITEARTMTIRVTPRFSAEDYTFGLFGNGTAVPSPYFDDCPTITPLSLGTTEALVLSSFDTVEDERWYSVDLEARDYVLTSAATRTDGTDRNIIYSFDYGSQFGKESRFEQVSRVNELGITRAEDSSALRASDAGQVWLRLRGPTELNLEFTLQPES